MITVKIMDGTLCMEKDITTLTEAKSKAEGHIRCTVYQDIDDIIIYEVNPDRYPGDSSESIACIFYAPVIEWV